MAIKCVSGLPSMAELRAASAFQQTFTHEFLYPIPHGPRTNPVLHRRMQFMRRSLRKTIACTAPPSQFEREEQPGVNKGLRSALPTHGHLPGGSQLGGGLAERRLRPCMQAVRERGCSRDAGSADTRLPALRRGMRTAVSRAAASDPGGLSRSRHRALLQGTCEISTRANRDTGHAGLRAREDDPHRIPGCFRSRCAWH